MFRMIKNSLNETDSKCQKNHLNLKWKKCEQSHPENICFLISFS